MKLKELELSKNIKNPVYGPNDILKKSGWKVLGDGMSGAVAENPNKNYVLKLFRNDPNYEVFLNVMANNQSNPHVPKISREVRKVPGSEYFYVRMEKLKKVTVPELFGHFAPEICYITVLAHQYDIPMAESTENNVWGILDRHKVDFDVLRNVDITEMFKKLGRFPDKSWYDIVDIVLKNVDVTESSYLDIHDENFMKRGSTLVITDPY